MTRYVDLIIIVRSETTIAITKILNRVVVGKGVGRPVARDDRLVRDQRKRPVNEKTKLPNVCTTLGD